MPFKGVYQRLALHIPQPGLGLSPEPLAIKAPSGLKVTEYTLSVCPSNVCTSVLAFTFHNRMVLSAEPLATGLRPG